jgi:hypothetical protein
VNSALALLSKKLADGSVPFSSALAISDPADSLRKREQVSFISEWKRVWPILHLDSRGQLLKSSDEQSILEIGEMAHKAALPVSPSIEFANLVWNDFDLIARSLSNLRFDPWVNALWLAYKSGRFPSGTLSPVDGSLTELI